MKKTILAVTMAASLTLLAACGGADGEKKSEVIAETAHGNVTEQDLYVEMKDAIGKDAFQKIVLGKILDSEYKLEKDEVQEAFDAQKDMYGAQFEALLAQNGMTEDAFKSNLKFQLLEQKLLDTIEVKEEDVNKVVENSKKEIHAYHILVKKEDEAKDLIKKLDEGADFAELGKEHSIEPGADQTGGDLGWFGVGKMTYPFEEAAYALEKDAYSKEPVKTEHGYHVIKLIDTRDAEEVPEGEEAKTNAEQIIKRYLTQQKLAELVKNAKIDVKDEDLKDVFNNFK